LLPEQLQKIMPHASVTPIPFERILLTGFRATGKSLVGQLLADSLERKFLDTDALLCQRFDSSITTFVRKYGWNRFRHQEEQLLLDLCHQADVVIATGGGAILHEQAWQLLRRQSFCVWLQADEATIRQRLSKDDKSADQRPSLTGRNPCLEIKTLLAERTPLYQKGSDLALQTDGRTAQELVDKIEQHLILMVDNYSDGTR
jgi:shikimate kinase